MTFDAVERSLDQGRPVEIYTFARDYQRWRFTSADRPIEALSNVFEPVALQRTQVEITQEKAKLGIKITAPRDFPISELFRISPPTLAITCIIQEFHEGDGEIAVVWAGRVLSVAWERGPTSVLTMEPTYTSLKRNGLRKAYQAQCPHVLYGPQCGANREAFRTDGNVVAVAGNEVTISEAGAIPDGAFEGGYLEWDIEIGIPERRFIIGHVDTVITVSALPFGLTVGTPTKLYLGCNHTPVVCDGTFGNIDRYGGFPYFPLKNPFAGDPVF